MMLEGNQRGGAYQMAHHLMNMQDNEHVEVHEISGFISDTVFGALEEIHAASKGTKCKQFMFSVSLNPPQNETAPTEYFENALARIEEKTGLSAQSRVIVFHEKEGRRHAHCIWSRIDADQMKAINLPHYKRKLNNISKDLFLEYDWTLPQGFIDKAMRNPLNLSREEWQQAKRSEQDPRLLKKLFQRAWQISDSKHAFEKALKEHGLWLAQGDRRGFVAIDYKGEIYSLSRWASVKTRALKQKLGDPEELLTVQEIQDHIADKMTRALKEHIKSIEDKFKKDFAPFKFAIQKLKRDHNHERKELREHHKDRWIAEEKTRIDAHTSYAAAAIFGVDLSILDNRPIEKYEIIFLDSHGLKNIETVFIMKEMAHE
ncbi:MAG: relaxase/mobilization nuclease domain-containing protein [Alphaproteobacteria bacterium]